MLFTKILFLSFLLIPIRNQTRKNLNFPSPKLYKRKFLNGASNMDREKSTASIRTVRKLVADWFVVRMRERENEKDFSNMKNSYEKIVQTLLCTQTQSNRLSTSRYERNKDGENVESTRKKGCFPWWFSWLLAESIFYHITHTHPLTHTHTNRGALLEIFFRFFAFSTNFFLCRFKQKMIFFNHYRCELYSRWKHEVIGKERKNSFFFQWWSRRVNRKRIKSWVVGG